VRNKLWSNGKTARSAAFTSGVWRRACCISWWMLPVVEATSSLAKMLDANLMRQPSGWSVKARPDGEAWQCSTSISAIMDSVEAAADDAMATENAH
jgi:hypothetical protein